MTRYALHFDPRAKREWDSLDGSVKIQFKKALAKRLEDPHVVSAELPEVGMGKGRFSEKDEI